MRKNFILSSCLFVSSLIIFSAFTSGKKSKKAVVSSYAVTLIDRSATSTAEEQWTWELVNPNPGNGDNGTLQDVSHWDMALPAAAEAALVAAEYSRDGNSWHSISIEMDRDPSIRACTSIDVLKFPVSTNGSQPVYFRCTFNQKFNYNAWATSYIKTGGGREGCNLYYFGGLGGPRFD
jgi:hypothetical protein